MTWSATSQSVGRTERGMPPSADGTGTAIATAGAGSVAARSVAAGTAAAGAGTATAGAGTAAGSTQCRSSANGYVGNAVRRPPPSRYRRDQSTAAPSR